MMGLGDLAARLRRLEAVVAPAGDADGVHVAIVYEGDDVPPAPPEGLQVVIRKLCRREEGTPGTAVGSRRSPDLG